MFKVRPGVSRCGKFGFALFRRVCLGQALVSNHSRDRHGSIFDGAEWDMERSGKARKVPAVFVESRLLTNLSRGRHGCVFEDAERDAL
jgi:hypothetical protein